MTSASIAVGRRVPVRVVALIAGCCGVTVANIYLAFPLITLIARGFGVGTSDAASVATVSQIGYALGLFFVIPLGDVVRRKRLLSVLVAGAVVGLVIASTAPSLGVLGISTFFFSGLTIAPHVLIPFVLSIVPEDSRGRALATINAAMTAGIAASRVGGALLGEAAGFRTVYLVAATATLCVGVATILMLPREQRRAGMSYPALIGSTLALLRQEPRLLRYIALQLPVFATFNLVWAMMAVFLTQRPYQFSVAAAGLFGLFALAPLASAGFVGRLLDRRGPAPLIGLSLGVLLVAAVTLEFAPVHVAFVVAGLVLLALGQQGAGIGNQSRTLALRESARSRLNTLYMTSNFVGGAIASALATALYASFGWSGVATGAVGTALLAGAVWLLPARRVRV